MSEQGLPPNDDELVAYLDGELDDSRARQVEDLLARDPKIRERAQDLERAWDVLDKLPQSEPTEVFTQSTIELVLGDVTRQKNRTRLALVRRVAAAAILLFIPLMFGSTAFWAIRRSQMRPTEELIRDLQVIQNVDVYTKIPSVEFLEKLRDEGVFSVELTDDTASGIENEVSDR